MLTMSLDNALWLAFVATEAAVIGLLLYRRAWRIFPVFSAYCVWDLLSTAGNYAVLRFFPAGYARVYLAEFVVDSALEFGVLVELTWSVLRPLRSSLPRGALVVIGALIVAIGAAIWPFAGIHELASLTPVMRNLVRVQQTVSILRILFFLALAGCSQLLSIGWRDRELQIATGLGIYSIVSLTVAVLQTHQVLGPQFRHLQQVAVVGSICFPLLYWVFAFAQQEAERREFTPQMQNFLLAVAGYARVTRVALTDSTVARAGKRDEP